MESDERTFEFSGHFEPAQVADYLEALARYINSGHAELAAGSESIQLSFSSDLKLELVAKTKPQKGKGSLQLDISWKQPPHFEEPLRIEPGEEEPASSSLEIGGGSRPNRRNPATDPNS